MSPSAIALIDAAIATQKEVRRETLEEVEAWIEGEISYQNHFTGRTGANVIVNRTLRRALDAIKKMPRESA